MMFYTDIIIMSVGALLTLIGTVIGVVIIIRSSGRFKISILFLTLGLGTYVIYHIINLFEIRIKLLGEYEFLIGIIHLIAISLIIISLINTERMITRIDKESATKNIKKRK